METQKLLQIAIITSISSLLIGIVSIYLTLWFLKNKILSKTGVKWNENTFFSILAFGALLGIGIMVSGATSSISTTLKIAMRNQNESVYTETFKFISLTALITLFGVVLLNMFSNFTIRSIFDKTDTATELKQGSNSYAILYCAIFISLSLVLKEGISLLSEILIPFETVNF